MFNHFYRNELYSLYPNKFITFSESRICVQHTLYEFPESYLLACIVDLFTNSKDFKSEETGVKNGDVFISFQAIYQDVRESIENLYRSVSFNLFLFIQIEKNFWLLIINFVCSNILVFYSKRDYQKHWEVHCQGR
jgi:hypothetical protein